MSAAQDLTAKLGGKWHGTYGSAICPAHEDREPSLSIRDGDIAPLLTCHAGCDRSAIFDRLKARGLLEGRIGHSEPRQRIAPRGPSPEERRNHLNALRIWLECKPAADSVVETYLRGRGIDEFPTTLRYHPGLKHSDVGLIFPALVAAVQAPDRAVIAIQRIFLQPMGRGKAAISRPKMALGSMRDGAVRLAAAGPVLGIAEGIETALSAMQIFDVPVLASLGAKRLKAVTLPAEVQRVIVFGDRGEEGEQQARAAADEFLRQGRRAEVCLPDQGFGDWNDALRGRRCKFARNSDPLRGGFRVQS